MREICAWQPKHENCATEQLKVDYADDGLVLLPRLSVSERRGASRKGWEGGPLPRAIPVFAAICRARRIPRSCCLNYDVLGSDSSESCEDPS